MESAGRNMIKTDTNKKENRIYFFIFLLVWCIQMLTAVYFCCQKQGFHEDEFYTYYSTARTNGLIIEDNAWMERDAYLNEFVVLKGQGFQYGLVRLVQSWDVHPPVYYWIFHTVCSFFPGQFSKWFGLGINLAAFGLSMFLMRCLALKVTGRNERLTLLVCLFYGFTPAVMSSVVFIRMYALLTVFVYLCALLHMSVVEKDRKSMGALFESASGEVQKKRTEKLPFGKFLLPLMAVTYFGFLTQYYYFIFLFFMAFAFCLYLLWRDRNLWNCIRYGGSLAIAFVLAYLTYPSCLGQMFRGQRGAQATSNFFDFSNTLERIAFFWELMDEYVFGKILLPLLILLLVMFVFMVGKSYAKAREEGKRQAEYESLEKDKQPGKWKQTGKCKQTEKQKLAGILEILYEWWKNNTAWWILLLTAAGYFLAVSKTALLLGNTSVRYQTPIYGMAVLLLFGAVWGIAERFCRHRKDHDSICGDKKEELTGENIRHGKRGLVLTIMVVLYTLVNLAGLSERVVFLYPEAAERIAFAKEKATQNVPVVCLYDAGQSWCVWDCADEFFEYDRIYFASQSDMGPISDAAVAGSGELVVYLSNTAEKQEQLQRILNSNPRLTEYELQYQEKYCDVYYFHE